jgi:hypothetical protein
MAASAARLAVMMETISVQSITIIVRAIALTLKLILMMTQKMEEIAESRHEPIRATRKHHLLCDCLRCNPAPSVYMKKLEKAFRD